MSQAKAAINDEALEVALAAARRLPRPAQRVLAERLLQGTVNRPHTVIVPLQQFDTDTQQRFQALMDRNNEDQLTPAERRELDALVQQYERMMVANSEALVRASHPALFDEAGRLAKSRLDRAIREKLRGKRDRLKRKGGLPKS